MDLVCLGIVGRPHGFRGAFMARKHSGHASALGTAERIWIGSNTLSAEPHQIKEAKFMPKGWKLTLKDWESDAAVKEHSGESIFVERSVLPPTEPNEYYLADLEDAQVIDADSGDCIGKFIGIEECPALEQSGSVDRWWFNIEGKSVALPALSRYLVDIDIEQKKISVRNYRDFLDL